MPDYVGNSLPPQEAENSIPIQERFVSVKDKLGKQIDELPLSSIDSVSLSIRGNRDQASFHFVMLKTASGEYAVALESDPKIQQLFPELAGQASVNNQESGWILIDLQNKKGYKISKETMQTGTIKVGRPFTSVIQDNVQSIIAVDLSHSYSPEELEALTANTASQGPANNELADALRLVGQHLSGTIQNLRDKRNK